MRHHFLTTLMLLVLAALIPSTASGYDFEVDSIYYLINGNNVSVTKKDQNYNSYHGDVVIPPTVTHDGVTYTVTAIDDHAFNKSSDLTSVIIPNTITQIGIGAFFDCTKLTTIDIPNSVITMGNGTFNGCTSLTAVDIPNSVVSIGNGFCYGCSKLTSLHIGTGLAQIGSTPFRGCSRLTSIVIDSQNTHFDSREDCNAIIETATNTLIVGCKTSVIPNTVRAIGYAAFITLPIYEITIPNSVTTIGEYAFCLTSLRYVDIPNSVITISESAFQSCSNLKNVTFGNSLTEIGAEAFANCSELTSIYLPESATSISNTSFRSCGKLDTIMIAPGNPVYDSRDNCNAIIETATNKLFAGCRTSRIPNTITTIGEYAFYGSNLPIAIIPASVTSIEYYAFSFCRSLTDVFCYIPDPTLVQMGSRVFNLNSYESLDYRTLHVINDAVEAYQADTRWQPNFGEIVGMDPNTVLASSISMNPNKIRLYMGFTTQLTPIILPVETTDKTATWTSSKTNVVTVDSLGVLTPVREGTAIITATTNDKTNLSATCEVTVKNFVSDINDCTTLISYLLGAQVGYFNEDYYDFNGDGMIDISDVSTLISLLLSKKD